MATSKALQAQVKKSGRALGTAIEKQIKTVTAASYTLLASDNGKTILFNRATAQAITVPASLRAGFNVEMIQVGVGRVTLSAGAGAALTGESGTRLTQYGRTVLTVTGNNMARTAAAAFMSGGTPLGLASTISLNTTLARNDDGTTMVATAPSGNNFIVDNAIGTRARVKGPAVQNTTKLSSLMFDVALPASYVAGADLSVAVNAQYAGTGTVGTKAVDVECYKIAADGSCGADICATAAQNLTNAAAVTTFVVTGTTLAPGDRIQLRVTTNLQETANVNPVNSQINSIKLS